MKIEVAQVLLRKLRSLDSSSRKQIRTAINLAAAAWGNPHLHAGTGLRKLGNDYFECRSGLQVRLVFKAFPDTLHFVFMGSHDEVRRFIKSSR